MAPGVLTDYAGSYFSRPAHTFSVLVQPRMSSEGFRSGGEVGDAREGGPLQTKVISLTFIHLE